MQNQITVKVAIPWVDTIDEHTYKNLQSRILKISRDKSSISCSEANHFVSGMLQRNPVYSYEAVPDEISFSAYANLSKYMPDGNLDILFGKIGEHVQTGEKDDVNYYNVVHVSFKDGQMVSQTVGHLEPDENAVIEDYVILTGDQMKSKLSSIKSVAVSEASNHSSETVSPEIAEPAKEQALDFSL